ncbi:probable non-specific lipid-transfer protein akcs9 [Phtheirospermum japonicum]|uniref:Probable non-specific lipid-transfer protein akcs9 n=1 Tax=Phtheirospermum japonicum TaxID=374723 RepID=A0A830BCI4_9LAMI|nr:probable non-specific lipid-transfer protein akcs9 [Phtheirospermum japonicum]
MTNKGSSVSVAAWCLVAVVVLLVAEVQETGAVTCNPTELSPCLGAITGSGVPSAECCNKLREQVPCFCGYIRNPALKPYIDSPNAKRVAAACGVSIPSC